MVEMRGIAPSAGQQIPLLRLLILAKVNFSRISLRCAEPRDVLLCKTGGSGHSSAKT
jgi:hypothetical protein